MLFKEMEHDRFDEFWELYPRKVAKDYTRKCFKRLNPDADMFHSMLKWIEAARGSEQWSDPRWIPHPSTWLNQRRWEGDVPLAKAALKTRDEVGLYEGPEIPKSEEYLEALRLRAKAFDF